MESKPASEAEKQPATAGSAEATIPSTSQNPTSTSTASNETLAQRSSLSRIRPQTPYTPPPPTTTPTLTPTSSTASTTLQSASSSAVPRGGLGIGVPAHHPSRAQQPFTTFGPSPPLTHHHSQFGPMHPRPDPSPTSGAQVRPTLAAPAGVHNIGTIGSLAASQLRASSVPASQPQRLPQPSVSVRTTIPSPPPNSALNPQKFANQGLTRPPQSISNPNAPSSLAQQMHAASVPPSSSTASAPYRPQQRPQVLQPRPYQPMPATSLAQSSLSSQQTASRVPATHNNNNNKADNAHASGLLQQGVVQTGDMNMMLLNVDNSESTDKILTKRSIRELVAQIDPSEKLDSEVEDVLIDIAEDFVESVTTFACTLAKHRKSTTLEAKDILLHAERNWNITLPGFSGEEIKLYKKQNVNDIHRERLALIKKSVAGNAKSAAALQAAAEQKNHASKTHFIGSPTT